MGSIMARARLRDLGISVGMLPTGEFNTITDVAGVKVGYSALIRDTPQIVRTGVAAIWPRGSEIWTDYVFAGTFSFNGNGEMTGRAPRFRTQPLHRAAAHHGGVSHAVQRQADRAGMLRPGHRQQGCATPALMENCEEMAEMICESSPLAVQAAICLYRLAAAFPPSLVSYARHLDQEVAESEDGAEGPRAFREKRKPEWKTR
jgi:hypothetical protein